MKQGCFFLDQQLHCHWRCLGSRCWRVFAGSWRDWSSSAAWTWMSWRNQCKWCSLPLLSSPLCLTPQTEETPLPVCRRYVSTSALILIISCSSPGPLERSYLVVCLFSRLDGQYRRVLCFCFVLPPPLHPHQKKNVTVWSLKKGHNKCSKQYKQGSGLKTFDYNISSQWHWLQ